jgi:hypothetical protein
MLGAVELKESEMDQSEAVLQGLLYVLQKDVFRTKLVKLTYLLDESNYRLRGHTMTGFAYEWDHYGPNAEGNAIVSKLDEMVETGSVSTRVSRTPYGNSAYNYRVAPSYDPSSLPLSNDDWIEICTAVHKYGAMNTRQIVRASKSTAPVLKGRQHETLEFEQDPPLTPEDIERDPFWKETLAAMADTSERITIEELREKGG